MIITTAKKIDDVLASVGDKRNIFIVGCGSCAKACKTGGEPEVLAMKEELESRGRHVTGWIVPDETCHMNLTRKLVMEHQDEFVRSDAVLVLSCGAGVQTMSALFEKTPVFPALDTGFLGNTKRVGDFVENCSLCGECVLGETASICPVTRCPKGLLHGPCGGMDDGKCELDKTRDCAWVRIYERLKEQGQLDKMRTIKPMKDYSRHTKPSSLNIGERARSKL
ncbi:MAG TPA: methylenetetrahydrofolate reductase C-terminal domain-containing protein [bacterium]|nr:methylenetetrahydrofolate reductase C-terminal domain-containing protein [bacterium]